MMEATEEKTVEQAVQGGPAIWGIAILSHPEDGNAAAHTDTSTDVDFVFPQKTVYLTDILAATGRTVSNNSELSIDGDEGAIILSDHIAKNNNIGKITLTATDHFEQAILTIRKNKNNVQTITLSFPASGEPVEQTIEAAMPPALSDVDMTLSGLLPDGATAVV